MRNYSEVALYINDNKTSCLEIFDEHNIFHIYEYGKNVFSGSWAKAHEFCVNWKNEHEELASMFESLGAKTEFKGALLS